MEILDWEPKLVRWLRNWELIMALNFTIKSLKASVQIIILLSIEAWG